MEQLENQRKAAARAGMNKLVLMVENVKTGQISALVTNQALESGVNPIAERIPTGTLATPFNYIALLEKFPERAAGTFEDTPTRLPGYPCINRSAPKRGGNCLFNLDMRYMGNLTLTEALGGLRSVTAVKALAETGNATYETAAKMGSDGACYADQELTEETPCHSAAAFGEGLYATPQHLMQAYATLANRGEKVPQSTLLKAVLNGQQQYAWQAPEAERVISDTTARTIGSILADPSASFIAASHKDVFGKVNGEKISVASGFTQQATHASSVQFTEKYVVGFWGTGDVRLTGDVVRGIALPTASDLLKVTN